MKVLKFILCAFQRKQPKSIGEAVYMPGWVGGQLEKNEHMQTHIKL